MDSAHATAQVSDFLARPFDYIVIGGGTAGLVVASRLTTNPNVTVGVLEAGNASLDDPNVLKLTGMAAMMHNPAYDWMYQSSGNLNRSHHIPKGKVLGGSSAINFMAYGRPSATDLDNWDTALGNPGWSWADLAPYYRKSERLEADPDHLEAPATDVCPIQTQFHGINGAIHTSLSPWQAPVETSLLAALDQTSQIPRAQEPWSGEHLGPHRSLFTVDRTGLPQRSYSANGYLLPALKRPNLKVLTNALASRVLFDDDQRAIGVEFVSGEATHQAFVAREVILSAGTYESPKLLELSGIGDPDLLRKVGIACRVAQPEVGQNLQEKPVSAVVYQLADGCMSVDSLFRDPALLQEHLRLLQEEHSGAMSGAISLMGFMKQRHRTVAHLLDRHAAAIQVVGIPTNFGIGHAYLDCSKLSPGAPPGGNACYSLMVSSMYPVSRGSSHVQSSDPLVPPQIDLGFLAHPADADVLAAGVTFADRVFQSEPMRGQVKTRVEPSPDIDLEDRDQARGYVRDRVMSYHHAAGTCALGTVVDERLYVRGVKGLRVVDASVFPTQVSHAILSTVYAVAEKAADLIREDYSSWTV
ncbi:alcohol oxidase [Aspergillus ellipticus CBS 707.79]|uniref:Alcohol oxidase n=1 Tax=Aspergillus ellipticus CBS 707.79 TaxID=1448320 RepID=A0A319DHJ1_9EURO|nr:alcohol oxidase [Aspergillus ellipticus CBS 707.79]